jgi:hypothetical protein
LLIEKEFIEKETIQRQKELINTDYVYNQIAAENELRESLRRLRIYDPVVRRDINVYQSGLS